MNNLLVWSGGFDSTGVLLEYLNNENIDTVYFKSLNIGEDKIKKELWARKMILAHIEKITGIKINDRVIDIGAVNLSDIPRNIITGWQSHLWLLGLLYSLRSDKHYDKIILGYIYGDEFWHYKDAFEKSFRNMYDLMIPRKEQLDYEKKIPRLWFPFEWQRKKQIYKRNFNTTQLGKDIFKMIWTCEHITSNLRSCGRCHKCKELKNISKGE